MDSGQEDEDELVGVQCEIPNEINPETDTTTDQKDLKKAAADILIEFLEAVLHQILYTQNVYPSEVFLSRQKYGIPIEVACHPGLIDYITKSLNGMKLLLQNNELNEVLFVVVDKETSAKQIFCFEINLINGNIGEDSSLMKIEQSFRSLLVAVITYCSSSKPNFKKPTFEIHATCNCSCELELNIPNSLQWTKTQDMSIKSHVTPIQVVHEPLIKLQLLIKEMV